MGMATPADGAAWIPVSLTCRSPASTRAMPTDRASAVTYDNAALTDTSLSNATAVAATLFLINYNGWYVNYVSGTGTDPLTGLTVAHNATDEKTASSALALGGCLIWNSLIPNPSGAQIACGASGVPKDSAALYHADAISGAMACGSIAAPASGTLRYSTRAAVVPPPMPTPVVSLNAATGKEAFSGISLDPGAPPSTIQVGTADIKGDIHWLQIDRKLHNCRHGTSATDCGQ